MYVLNLTYARLDVTLPRELINLEASMLTRIFKSAVLTAGLLATPARAAEDNSLTNALRELLAQAEDGVAKGELQLAESHYRVSLLETWMQLAMSEVVAGDWPAARGALEQSTRSAATGERRTRSSLALVKLWLDETDEALELLRDLADRHPKNTQVRQLFAQALLAAGRLEEAGRQLEDMRPRMPKAVEAIERYVEKFDAEEQAAGEKADWPARRKAFLPAAGGGAFEGLAPADLEAEKVRLRATQVRVYRNLAVLDNRHPACARALLARAEEIAAAGGETAGMSHLPPSGQTWKQAAYGTVDLSENQLVPIQPLRADVTALWQSARVEHLPAMRLIEEGELSAAEKELRKMLEQKDDPLARDMLGVLLADRGKIEEARRQFAAIVAAAPESLPARQHLLRLDLLAGKDQDRVSAELRAIAELGPMERDLELELASIEIAAGEVEAARRRLFDTAHRFNSPRAFLRLAEVLAGRGDLQAGVDNAIKAMRLAPSSEEVLATYARYSHQVGKAGKALGVVEPLVRLYPHVAEYHFLHAVAALDREDLTTARAALEKAMEIDPAMAEGESKLSIVRARLADLENL